jgi:hypothetical protein
MRAWRGVMLVPTMVVAVVVILTGLTLSGSDNGPTPAFGAALVRFANSTPLILLQLPGWHVTYVQQDTNGRGNVDGHGEIHFVRGPRRSDGPDGPVGARTEPVLSGRFAQLTWGRANAYIRAHPQLGGHQHTPTGLGVPAVRYVTEGRSRHWIDLTAYFVYGSYILAFRATAPTMAAYRAELEALHKVTATTWLEAMPPSVIKSADSRAAVRRILRGIPLPPGFDAATIHGEALTQNRYLLAVSVIGTVACNWVADWAHSRATGNKAEETRAVAMMATAPHWPAFTWMDREGGWSSVVTDSAKALTTGRWFGRPLTVHALREDLGCRRLGVEP